MRLAVRRIGANGLLKFDGSVAEIALLKKFKSGSVVSFGRFIFLSVDP